MAASLWTYFIPLYILAALLVVLGVLVLLSRIQGGRYLRPIIQTIAKVPLFRRGLTKASQAALERENPELASAMRKLERFGAIKDPRRAQQALNLLTPAERRAWLEAAEQQGAMEQPIGRAQRRQLERMQKGSAGGPSARPTGRRKRR